jgi:hypothetical protein
MGVDQLVGFLQQRIYMCKMKVMVKQIVKGCILCKKINARCARPEIAPLPEDRANISHPFASAGLDFFGPITLKSGTKAYGLLFTCSTTRAVHLAVTKGLNFKSFLHRFLQFVSLYGCPNIIHCNNAPTFILARKVFKSTIPTHNGVSWDTIMTRLDISWRFNPPTSPWWGGFYERIVGSVKRNLFKVYGNAKLTFEELETAMAQCQWNLNSRPLTSNVTDTNIVALTPFYLMFGSKHELRSCVLSLEDCPNTPLTRVKSLNECLANFQQRWTLEYRNILLDDVKHRRPAPTPLVKIGDVGLLWQPNKKRFHWPMGKIVDVFPGEDGKIRSINVRTADGTYSRAIDHFIPLLS